MAASALNRPGQDNAAGDAFANFKMIYSGLIAQQYPRGLKFADRITKRTFPKGAKSIEVKFHDAESAAYHTPGHDILVDGSYLGNPQKGSKEIKLGAKLLKAGLLDWCDGYIEDFDSSKEHAYAIKEALQRIDDQLSFRAIVAAANRNGGADEYTNEPDLGASVGTQTLTVSGAHDSTKAGVLKDAILAAGEAFDAVDLPDDGRCIALTPFAYNLLFYITDQAFLNRDYGNNANGSLSERKILRAGGFDVIRSNNIPTTDLSADTARQTELNLDFTKTIGAIFHKDAAIRGVAKEVMFDSWFDKRMRADAYVAEFVAGFGSYRREAAIWLKRN